MGLLRFYLALAVVNVHGHIFNHNLIYPDIAVQSFFMISGFYMAMILNEKYNHPSVTYMDFIMSRFFRIAPAYFLMGLLTIIVSLVAWFGFSSQLSPIKYWVDYKNQLTIGSIIYIILVQFSLIGLDTIMFSTVNAFGGLVHTLDFNAHNVKLWHLLLVPQGWTLALEFYFYLLAPFIVKRSIKFIVTLIVASFIFRLVAAVFFNLHLDPWSYRFFPFEIMFFLSGSLAYRLSKKLDFEDSYTKKLILGFCFLLIIGAGMIGRYASLRNNLYLLSPIFIGVVFLSIPKLFELTKFIKADRYIGELSYPLYISHMLVIWIADLSVIKGGVHEKALILFGSIIFSILIYELVDKRVDQFRHRKFSKEI